MSALRSKFIGSVILGHLLINSAMAEVQLSDSIPYPFHAVQKSIDGHQNKIMILNSGIAALQKRLDIIKKAKKHIEVEYFIYSTDKSSQLINQELIKAAQRGVKVRLLVDTCFAVFQFDERYATVMAEYGIEVKYYNVVSFLPTNPKNLLAISDMNFRNHRKLLSVDDKYAISGGRNIEDDYFDFSPNFNFNDRDIYIEGDMAKVMRESFDKYFTHKISSMPDLISRPSETRRIYKRSYDGKTAKWITVSNKKAIDIYNDKLKPIKEFFTSTSETKELAKKVEKIARPILNSSKLLTCPELTFSTDAPGGNFLTRLFQNYSDKYRYLRKTIYDKAIAADKKVVVSSPYMINNSYSKELMYQLLSKGIEIDLYTNSLASTDAIYIAANLYKDYTRWIDLGMNVYIHNGNFLNETDVIDDKVKDAKWGTHSKTQIYYNSHYSEFMIGTYNVDNRSNHYNSEMAIFCKGSDELTQIVAESINNRIEHAYKLDQYDGARTSQGQSVSVFGSSSQDLLKMHIIAMPSWLLKFLL